MADSSPISQTDLFDFVMAEHLALRAFMLSISVEFAREQNDPFKWTRDFIATLHARMDVHEKSLGAVASSLPSHEMARKKFDVLGGEIERALKEEP